MKFSLKYTILLSASLIGFSSCEDLLIEEPRTVSVENFYNTFEEVQSAINAIYPPLRSTRAEQIAILDAHTDWGYGRGSRAQYNDFAGLNPTNQNTAAARWNSFYLAIRNANLVIANASKSTVLKSDDLNYYLAEARFLRALAYFDLVRNWAGVPLRTENTLTQIDLPRSSVQEVYNLILADLQFAEQNLGQNPKNIGRPTTFAAKTMMADVYMHLGNYQAARQKCQEVIQSGKFSLVPVQTIADIRAKIFGPDLVTSTEEIFYMKYTRLQGQGNFMLWILNHPSTGFFNFGGAFAHYSDASIPFYQEWDNNDLRKKLWDKINFGLGPNTLVISKYTDAAAAGQNGAGNDLPIYRYPEVLLMFAEAEARVAGSPTAAAIGALNQVRRRAFGFAPNSASTVDLTFQPAEQNQFIDRVLQEKAYEFQFEGKRWYDLKRTGKAQEMIGKNRGKTIAQAHFLWPIPIEEINFNKAIDPKTGQNPGY